MYYDDGKIIVRKSKKSDCDDLAFDMRESDKQEVWASDHLSPLEALQRSFSESVFCLTIVNEGVIVGMFGVNPEAIIGHSATVWFLASDELEKIKYKFLKYSRSFIGIMLENYPYLHNWVDARNEKSILWLKMCGAKVDEKCKYGIDRLPFHYFSFTKKSQEIVKTFSPEDIRTKTDILKNAMMIFPGADIKGAETCMLKHDFMDGSYMRTITMPKNILVVSEIHKKRHPYFILKGRVTVVTEDGPIEIVAPYQGITEPGTRRALFCHEETVWATVHVTDKTDLKEIRQEIIAENFDEIEHLEVQKCLG